MRDCLFYGKIYYILFYFSVVTTQLMASMALSLAGIVLFVFNDLTFSYQGILACLVRRERL